MIIGAALLIGAALMASNNFIEASRSDKEAVAALDEIKGLMDEAGITSADTDVTVSPKFAEDDQQHTADPADPLSSELQGLDSASSDIEANQYIGPRYDPKDSRYLGIIRFYSLRLEVPVMKTLTEANLKKAPCLYTGSLEDQNAVIAGHNYKSHFSRLKRLKKGDTLIITTLDGTVRKYKVGISETIDPYDIAGMTGSGWDLTLFTCTASGEARYAVRCSLAEE